VVWFVIFVTAAVFKTLEVILLKEELPPRDSKHIS